MKRRTSSIDCGFVDNNPFLMNFLRKNDQLRLPGQQFYQLQPQETRITVLIGLRGGGGGTLL